MVEEVIAIFRKPANLRRTSLVALIVGSVLTLINELDVFIAGRPTVLTTVKVALNFCVPFIVSNVGLVLGARAARG
jgi:hypothetical protein